MAIFCMPALPRYITFYTFIDSLVPSGYVAVHSHGE